MNYVRVSTSQGAGTIVVSVWMSPPVATMSGTRGQG
jgi:hypothetical protein